MFSQEINNMAGNRTLTMIKPSAFESGYSGPIISEIEKAGFRIIGMRLVHLSHSEAESFYKVHKDRPFYIDLVRFMTSGPIIAAFLEKENAVEDFRKIIGNTDPAKAEKGTIRNLFGKSLTENAIHGSDSDETALLEGNFFFSFLDIV